LRVSFTSFLEWAKLVARKPGTQGLVLGNLTLFELSVGMALFTAVMVVDIFTFGEKMRKTFLRNAFGLQGKLVLVLLGALQCIGWLLVGYH